MRQSISTTDREIIRILQADARASFAEMSRQTGIPESTVRRRTERLQELGILHFSVVADPAKLGFEVRAIIGMRVNVELIDEVAETLRDMPEVSFAAFVTGSVDIITHVVVEHQERLVGLLQALASIDGIKSTETYVMPWVIKSADEWVLPEEPTSRR